MKKNLLLIIFAALCFSTFATPRISSILYQNWIYGNFRNYDLGSYTYDSHGYLTSIAYQKWDTANSIWTNGTLVTYTNNSDGTASTAIEQVWNGSSFANTTMSTYTYTNGKVATYLYQTWVSGSWQNSSMQTNSYDGNGYLISTNNQQWTTASSSWTNSTLINYTNNSNGTPSSSITQIWSTSSSSYSNISNAAYTYNAGGKVLTQTDQVYSSGSWKNQLLITSTYDANGYLASTYYQYWGAGNSWVNNMGTNYTNNSDGSINYAISQSWNTSNNSWVTGGKSIYSYGAAGIVEASAPLTTLYPNPAQNVININPADAAMPFDFILTDLTGRELSAKSNNIAMQSLDLSGYTPGIYLLQVTQGTLTFTQKIIRQ